MQVFINSKFMDDDKVSITPFTDGFMYGYGVFETIKIYDKHILFIAEHIQRLNDSLRFLRLNLDYNIDQIKNICTKLIESNCIVNGFVKIVCSKEAADNTNILIYTGNKYYDKQYQNGFKLCLASFKRNESSELCFIKSMNYTESIIQNRLAIERGFDEAVFLNTKNIVSECCISNIFWVKRDRVFTPSIECGLLPGIARQKAIELCEENKIPIVIGEFSLEEMKNADEIFLTNSLMDIMPVCVFEDKLFDIKKYKLTDELMKKYKIRYMRFL